MSEDYPWPKCGQEFEDWWEDAQTYYVSRKELARMAWDAGILANNVWE